MSCVPQIHPSRAPNVFSDKVDYLQRILDISRVLWVHPYAVVSVGDDSPHWSKHTKYIVFSCDEASASAWNCVYETHRGRASNLWSSFDSHIII